MFNICTSSYEAEGSQIKWHDDTFWYKLDKFGHEGLSEMVASSILRQSVYKYYIDYYTEVLTSPQGIVNKGCYSYNFLSINEKFLSITKLFKRNDFDIDSKVDITTSVEDKVKILVEAVIDITGLVDYGTYISDILYFDGYILNDDRHLSNFGVILNKDGVYSYPPIFDNGRSLLFKQNTLNTSFIPMYAYTKAVQARPFDSDFNYQSLIAEELYGRNLNINYDKDVLWNEMCKTPYTEEQINKVMNVLEYQDSLYFD